MQTNKRLRLLLDIGASQKNFPKLSKKSSKPHSKRAMEEDLGLDNNLEVFAGMIKGKKLCGNDVFLGCCELA